MAAKAKTEKKQHIHVFARVRPLCPMELRSPIVVECVNSQEVSVRDKNQLKTFTFDRVFEPESKQIDVYKTIVSPLTSEVLQGYNCTVFAYGQTGSGKTFTMIGEKSSYGSRSWEEDSTCGIIPRTLSHIFDELERKRDEFTVRVSFLELYNEELFDLLANDDDGKNLRLFEDSMKKGSVIISGLVEKTVSSKSDVYDILETGNLRRQSAATLMNSQSSRSHTIFTITVHIKVSTPDGEDLIKTGKMNLVDLAGSESIGRSGAVEIRAREAGSINQSLLTLGRVITSLVERAAHIPYRESKLTRLLQDSLGGRTKTSIIATVSPALCNVEESLSTFEYAHRARDITNKPEINQKTSKRLLLREYTEEIEKLRRDLIATREKHGMYVGSENLAIATEKENLNNELLSKMQLLQMREEELAKQEEILKSLNIDLYVTQTEFAATNQKLQEANTKLREEKDILNELGMQSNVLLQTADEAVNDAKNLHERLDKNRRILEHNFNSAEKFKNSYTWQLNNMKTKTKDFCTKGMSIVESEIEADQKFIATILANHMLLKELTSKIVKDASDQIQSLQEIIIEQSFSSQAFLNEHLHSLKSCVDCHNKKTHEIIGILSDYSSKMKSDWQKLYESFEKNKKNIENQNSDLQLVQEKLTEFTKMALALPAMFNSKLKQREEAIKSYSEKCEFLEKKQWNMRKQIKEFGEVVYKMAQDHLQLLQKDGECNEALRSARNARRYAEENFFSEITGCLQKNAADFNRLVEEAEKVHEKINKSAGDLMKNSTDIVFPIMNEIINTEGKFSIALKDMTYENSAILNRDLNKFKQLDEVEGSKLTKYSECLENRCDEILKSLQKYETEVTNNTNYQKNLVHNALQENINRKQALSSNIAEHSDDLFASIQDRVKEIETFFYEDIRRDDKAENALQRKANASIRSRTPEKVKRDPNYADKESHKNNNGGTTNIQTSSACSFPV